jgi:hypothetical protein
MGNSIDLLYRYTTNMGKKEETIEDLITAI